jgi:hypothetical protein
MKGWIMVEPDGLDSGRRLAEWIDHAEQFVRAYPKTAGDCPNFAQSSEQNGTVPFSEAVLG